jgi:acetyl-CoA synthetase
MCNGFSFDDASVFWAAGDWTSPQILLGIVHPALWYGCSIVSKDSTGSSENELSALMTRCEVTNAFISSSETNLLKQIQTVPLDLGTTLNVAYGTPETGLIATSCKQWFESDRGSSVRAAPGHSIKISGDRGRVAILRHDPALFLGYLNDSEKTRSAFDGEWFITRDEGQKNEDGDLYISPSSNHFGG